MVKIKQRHDRYFQLNFFKEMSSEEMTSEWKQN